MEGLSKDIAAQYCTAKAVPTFVQYSPLTVNADEKKPDAFASGFLNWVPGSDLLSHGSCHTIIGAAAFHF